MSPREKIPATSSSTNSSAGTGPPNNVSSRKLLHGLRGKHSVTDSLGRCSSNESSSQMGTSSGHSTVSSIGSSNHSPQRQQMIHGQDYSRHGGTPGAAAVRGQEAGPKAPPGVSASGIASTTMATNAVASIPTQVSGRSHGLGLGRRRRLNQHLKTSSNESTNSCDADIIVEGEATTSMSVTGSVGISERSLDTASINSSLASLPGMPSTKQLTSRRGPARRGLGAKKVSTMLVVEPNARPMVSSHGGLSPLEQGPTGTSASSGLRGSMRSLLSSTSSLTGSASRRRPVVKNPSHQLPSNDFPDSTISTSVSPLGIMHEDINVMLDSDDDDDNRQDKQLRLQQRGSFINHGMTPPSTTHRAAAVTTTLQESRSGVATHQHQSNHRHRPQGLARGTNDSKASLSTSSYRRVNSLNTPAPSSGHAVSSSQRRLHPISGHPMSASVTDASKRRLDSSASGVGAHAAHSPPAPHPFAAAAAASISHTGVGAHVANTPPAPHPALSANRRIDSDGIRARNNVRQASMRFRSAIPPVTARPITAPVIRAPELTPGAPLHAAVQPVSPTPVALGVAPNAVPLSAAAAAVQQQVPSPIRPRNGSQAIPPVAPAVAAAAAPAPESLYQPSQQDWAVLYNRHVEELERKDLEIAVKLSKLKPAAEEVVEDDDAASLDGVELAMEVSRCEVSNAGPNEDDVLQMVMEMSRTADMNASVANVNGTSVNNNVSHLHEFVPEEEAGDPNNDNNRTMALPMANDSAEEEVGVPKDPTDYGEDEEFLRALRLSSQEPPPLAPLSEEDELERVLRLSAESDQTSATGAVASSNDHDALDEDEQLRRILELSQQEHEQEQHKKRSANHEGEDDDFLRVLEMSQQEAAETDKERETMELVLQLSRQETGS